MALADCAPDDLAVVLTILAAQLGLTAHDEKLLEMLSRLEERGLIEVNVEDNVVNVSYGDNPTS